MTQRRAPYIIDTVPLLEIIVQDQEPDEDPLDVILAQVQKGDLEIQRASYRIRKLMQQEGLELLSGFVGGEPMVWPVESEPTQTLLTLVDTWRKMKAAERENGGRLAAQLLNDIEGMMERAAGNMWEWDDGAQVDIPEW